MRALLDWLEEKAKRGVKDVRVSTVLEKVREEAEPENGDPLAGLNKRAKKALMERLLADGIIPDLVGTSEAADELRVGKAQIGKWLNPGNGKAARMPEPMFEIKAGPLWPRSVIVAFKLEADSRKRRRNAA